MFLYFSFNFLRMGTTGFASQARGGEKDTRVVLLRGLLLSTGLGLALVSKIISDHGGWITVESVPGKTVFRISLPRADKTQIENTASDQEN